MTDLTDRLFAYAKIDRTSLEYIKAKSGNTARGKGYVSKFLDKWIETSGVKLTQDEKKMRTDLRIVALSKSSERERNSSYHFTPFNSRELENDMVLAIPRKVTAYVQSAKHLKEQTAAADKAAALAAGKSAKSTAKRAQRDGQKGGNPAWGVGLSKSRLSKAHMGDELAQFSRDDGMGGYSTMALDGGDAMSRKRARMSGLDDSSLADQGAPEEILSSGHDVILPINFFEVINNVFLKFWNMEFEDNQVNQAFFANIDNLNCKMYGLEVYAERCMSLSVIRDRVEGTKGIGQNVGKITNHNAYKSHEDFYSDFRQMFENINIFFPEDSPAKLKATELNTYFHTIWEEAKSTFKFKKGQ